MGAHLQLRSVAKPWVAVALITFVGLVLRIWQIGRVPLWGDEAQTGVIAHWPYWDLLTQPIDPSGGFYYSLHKALIPDGTSVMASRSISLVAGVLSIPLSYVTARLAIGHRAALLATALFALSLPLIDYSQEDRAYSVLVLMVLLSALGLLLWGRELDKLRPSLAPLVLFGSATVLAQYTHLVAFFWSITAFHAALSETIHRGSKRATQLIIGTTVVTCALLLPEAWRLFATVSGVGVLGWLPQASGIQFLQVVADTWLPTAFSGVILFSAVGAGLVGWGWFHRRTLRAWAEGHRFGPTVVIGLLLFPLFVWLFGYVFSPIFMQRTILPSAPGFMFILAMVGCASGRFVSGVFVIAYAASVLTQGTMRPREPWSLAVRQLTSEVKLGDAIIVCPTWKYPALRAALLKSVPAPAYVVRRGEILRIERQLGSAPDWAETFYQAILRDQYRSNLHLSQTWPAEQRAVPAPNRIWLIDGQCSEDDLAAINAWTGSERWTSRSTFGGVDLQSRISVSLAGTPPVVARLALVAHR